MVKINEDRDEMAFSNLFDFFAPKIKGYFIQNGLSSDNAEELTQEVMSVIWSKSDKYDVQNQLFLHGSIQLLEIKKLIF